MPKFQPSSDPKHAKLYDTTTKKHISFDDNGDDNSPAAPSVTTVNPAKKRSPSDPTTMDNKRPRPNAQRPKGTSIATPGADTSRPYLQKVEYKKTPKKQLTPAEIAARGLAKRDAKRQKMKDRRRTKKLIANGGDATTTTTPGATSVSLFQMTPDKQRGKTTIADLRNFILYCLTEGPAPKFARIARSSCVDRMVVVYVNGLDITSFGAPLSREDVPPLIDLANVDRAAAIGKANMPFLMSQVSHMLVTRMKSSTKDRNMHPLSDLLQCQVSWSRREKQYLELKQSK